MSSKICQNTDFPPCCIQVHHDGTIFIGMYDLVDSNPDKPVRNGYIYAYDQDLQLKNKVSSGDSAVLDLKISPKHPGLILSAQSCGNIGIWRWANGRLELVGDHKLFESTTLITALEFSPHDPELIALTLTDGQVATAALTSTGLELVSQWHEHTLEAWIPAFVPALKGLLLSGGDDQALIGYDIRSPTALWKTTRLHDAGVVSILAEKTSNQLWTGGYDDNLVVSDLRNLQIVAPKRLAMSNLGGGVWRLIPSPREDDHRILACCMYGGARILLPISKSNNDSNDGSNEDKAVEVVGSLVEGHESMVYGGAWTSDRVLTCSFYDKVVQTWDIDG